jgi:hypothetical protein
MHNRTFVRGSSAVYAKTLAQQRSRTAAVNCDTATFSQKSTLDFNIAIGVYFKQIDETNVI